MYLFIVLLKKKKNYNIVAVNERYCLNLVLILKKKLPTQYYYDVGLK